MMAQSAAPALPTPADYSAESFVAESSSTHISFENDGSYQRELRGAIRIQSESALQRFGVLTFGYQDSNESMDITYVRVRKPDGTTIMTPQDTAQDMPAEITRQAPLYSDLREKHMAVKSLAVGDVLEFASVSHSKKPLVPGQFWFAYNFTHDSIILREELQISVPRSRSVKLKSAHASSITEESSRRIYSWTESQLKAKTPEQIRIDQDQISYQSARASLPPAEVQISSFQSWEEIGRWYSSLQQDRIKPTPEIIAKATELTANAVDEDAKIRALYIFVSTQFRYIGVDFGIGRFQPHPASEVLNNRYGDCKDKHTLFASLLQAVGIKSYPALINSTLQLDSDIPSPNQFDHVISVVSQGSTLTWLDTTPELAPFGFLPGSLRGKPALLMPGDKPPVLIDTPTSFLVKPSQTFVIHAKLSADGALEGQIDRSYQGDDTEVLLRLAFRRVPVPQWKDLIQQLSMASGFAGDVSNTTATSPEKLEAPFHFSYTYSRKDYPDWPNRRLSSPLPLITLPSLDKDVVPTHPIFLGWPGETHFESHTELPKGYTSEAPADVSLQEDFAEYHASYSTNGSRLSTDRHLILKLREVPISSYEAYKKFVKAIENEQDTYFALSLGKPRSLSYQEAIWDLPYSQNPEAARAYDDARKQVLNHDTQGEIVSLQHAVQVDPKFTRAWLWLGEVFKSMARFDEAIQAYRRGIDADSTAIVGYKALGYTLLGMEKFQEALTVWQDLTKLAPKEGTAFAGLGSALAGLKRYRDAASAFETATKLKPGFAGFYTQLGRADLLTGDDDQALRAFEKTLEVDPDPRNLNDIAYNLADANKNLPLALKYAQRALTEQEENLSKVSLASLQEEDLGRSSTLGPFWDTLGWIYFRMGNLQQAEDYLQASWSLIQSPAAADHLAQVYEKLHKPQAALHMYRLALFCYHLLGPRRESSSKETRERFERLDRLYPNYSATTSGKSVDLGDEVNATRTLKLPRLVPGSASAEFFVILSKDPKTSAVRVEDTKFISGSERLKSAGQTLTSTSFKISFPAGNPRLIRRGILGCFESSGCSFVMYKPADVHSTN